MVADMSKDYCGDLCVSSQKIGKYIHTYMYVYYLYKYVWICMSFTMKALVINMYKYLINKILPKIYSS